MKIISHRGAAGLAPENTIKSIMMGARYADFIEIDVRLTRDQHIVLSHDESLQRMYNVNLSVRQHSLRELRMICPELPTLEQAIRAAKQCGIVIELKEFIEPKRLFAITDMFPTIQFRFASFNHNAIRAIKKYRPKAFCYVLEHHSPFEILNKASKMKASGVGLNYGVINPLTYFLAKRKKLHIYIYTLNNFWLARFLAWLYKDVYICTDRPDQLYRLQ